MGQHSTSALSALWSAIPSCAFLMGVLGVKVANWTLHLPLTAKNTQGLGLKHATPTS